MTDVRVRFPPSPTGYFHVGGARTALFNWLFARHHNGVFILRIEDTDRERYVADSLDDIVESMRWLGLEWNEGPKVGGPHGPYFQSKRLDMYHQYAEQLVEMGYAYRCYCSEERLARVRQEQREKGQPPGYDRRCRYLSDVEQAETASVQEASDDAPVIRLKVPLTGQTELHDVIRSNISFDNSTLEDIVLLKSDGYPTYHLANVVDDHHMKISHIMRGDEWISSGPLHLIMYDAFGWEPPIYAHLPMILDPSGEGKMSKRKTVGPEGTQYPVEVREFRAAGYLPEALVNFLAIQGWSYDDHTELFTREELIDNFTLDRIHPSSAAFNYDKLEWMNGVYIRKLDHDDLAQRLMPFLEEAGLEPDYETVRRLTPLVQERIKTLNEVVDLVDFVFQDEVSPDPDEVVYKNMAPAETVEVLEAAGERLAALESFDVENIEHALRSLAHERGMKAGPLFSPIRVAVTGKRVAPPLFGTLAAVGQDRVVERINQACTILKQRA